MGTRHLIAVYSGGAYKVAQYGQWDGYPGAQGMTVLGFCRLRLSTPEGRKTFAEAHLSRCRFLADGEAEGKTLKDLPFCDRDHGATILERIRTSAGPVVLADQISFAGDSLFCEWAYVVDLDKASLEVFEGFNRKPVPTGERFADAPVDKPGGEYFPVKLSAAWSLDDLPSNEMFLARFTSDEDES
jgi:hypothetical protein